MASAGRQRIARPSIVEMKEPVDDFARFLFEVSQKWVAEWQKARIHEADPRLDTPKFFVTAAFPYPNSPLHLGHGRTYTITDVYARYMRMKGYNVLFPMGFHYTGTPIITMAEAIASGDKELINLMIHMYDVPPEDIEKLKTPLGMARYFHEDAKKAMIEMGYSIDWRREFTTIDPEFSKFIEWQFIKLREKGYIVQGTHPVGWCPVHNMPVGMHDTKGDVEPEIGEFTVILFPLEGKDREYLAAATLRPETVYGVTNVWVNPSAKYVRVRVGDKTWIISERAAFKLGFQKEHVEKLGGIEAEELIGAWAVNPATGARVPVLPADFVDPDTATGVVMSVPAHAPYDYVALKELVEKQGELLSKLGISPEQLKPIPLIIVEGFSEIPARDIVEKMGVRSQKEKEKLDEATKELYSLELRKGRMRDDIVDLIRIGDEQASVYAKAAVKAWIAGRPVSEARENTKAWLSALGYTDVFYEILNKPVYCRCGNEIVVKVLHDQWFIDYSNPEWKKLAHELVDTMNIVPSVMREEFKKTIDWLQLRAAARTRGLGTRLPWSKDWIIESLSDSTIYMAFYTVAHLIKRHGIPAESLTPRFWDYVLLGKGSASMVARETGISPEVLEELRREFTYWYPLDSRHSGRDLVPNHLTFFIFNHVAIFPRNLWPRQIVVNGFVRLEGKKMSKSLRNVVPLRRVLRVYGPDTVRATLIASAELLQDADFTSELAESVLERLKWLYQLSREVVNAGNRDDSLASRWLNSILQKRIAEVTRAYDEFRYRHAAIVLLYEMGRDVEKFFKLGGRKDAEVLRKFVETMVLMIAPITPFIAEEIWHMLGGKGYVIHQRWPKTDEKERDYVVELYVDYADKIIDDIKEIVRVLNTKPERIYIAVAPQREWALFREVVSMALEKRSLSDVVRVIIGRVEKSLRREYSEKVRRMYDVAVSLSRDVAEKIVKVEEFDEMNVLAKLADYIKNEVGAREVVIISAESAEAAKAVGEAKLRATVPFRPAIVVEGKPST